MAVLMHLVVKVLHTSRNNVGKSFCVRHLAHVFAEPAGDELTSRSDRITGLFIRGVEVRWLSADLDGVLQIHLLIYHLLHVAFFWLFADLWVKFLDCEGNILFIECVRIPVLCIHAAEVDNVVNHVLGKERELGDHLVIERISIASDLVAQLFHLVFVKEQFAHIAHAVRVG